MTNINVTNLYKRLQKMENYGSQEFHDYYTYKHVGIGFPYYKACNCVCKFSEICAINNILQSDYEECFKYAHTTCGADQKYYSIMLMFGLFLVSKIIHMWFTVHKYILYTVYSLFETCGLPARRDKTIDGGHWRNRGGGTFWKNIFIKKTTDLLHFTSTCAKHWKGRVLAPPLSKQFLHLCEDGIMVFCQW